MTPQALAEAYFAAWNRHDAGAIVASLTPDGTYSDPTVGTLPAAALGDYADMLFAAFPDLSFELHRIDCIEQRVIAEWTMRGTNHGPFGGGPPTGKPIALPGIDIVTTSEGGVTSVRGFFDQRTLVDQLGLQVVVQPHTAGPFSFGRAVRVHSGKDTLPGALSLTWLEITDDDEVEAMISDSRQIAIEMLGMPGFVSWVGMVIGRRFVTLTAWDDVEAVSQLRGSAAHNRSMKRFFGNHASATAHTSVWSGARMNTFWVRCPACGTLADAAQGAATCACGIALPEQRLFL